MQDCVSLADQCALVALEARMTAAASLAGRLQQLQADRGAATADSSEGPVAGEAAATAGDEEAAAAGENAEESGAEDSEPAAAEPIDAEADAVVAVVASSASRPVSGSSVKAELQAVGGKAAGAGGQAGSMQQGGGGAVRECAGFVERLQREMDRMVNAATAQVLQVSGHR